MKGWPSSDLRASFTEEHRVFPFLLVSFLLTYPILIVANFIKCHLHIPTMTKRIGSWNGPEHLQEGCPRIGKTYSGLLMFPMYIELNLH